MARPRPRVRALGRPVGLALAVLPLLGLLLAPRPAASAPTVPESATELLACSTAGQLRQLGLLTVTGIRDDRPIALIRADGDLLWGRWTPVGRDEATTTGEPPSGSPAPLLDLVAPSEPGCWVWNRDPGAVLLIDPDGLSARGVLTDAAVAAALQLDASSMEGVGATPGQVAPVTTWTPEALGRFMTSRIPVAPPAPSDGALSPNAMVRGVLSTCPTWRPVVTLAAAGQDLALFCPAPDPAAELAGVEAVHRAAKLEVERTGDSLHIQGPFILLARVAAVAGGLIFTNSAELIADVMTDGGEPWWGDEAPATGIIQRTPTAMVHLERTDGMTRAELLFQEVFEVAALPVTPRVVDSLQVGRRGGPGGAARSQERR
jgi:hypothetical protein